MIATGMGDIREDDERTDGKEAKKKPWQAPESGSPARE